MNGAPSVIRHAASEDLLVFARLAMLPHAEQIGARALIDRILTLLLENLHVGLVFAAYSDGEILHVEREAHCNGMYLPEDTQLPLSDSCWGPLLDGTMQELEAGTCTVTWQVHGHQCSAGASTAVPLYRPNGALYGLLCTLHTEPRTARSYETALLHVAGRQIVQALDAEEVLDREHALVRDVAASARRLQLIYDAMPCGVLMLDAGGMITESNWAARNLLGMGDDELIGYAPDLIHQGPLLREDGTLFPDEQRPEIVAFETLQPMRATVCGLTRQDDEQRWFQFDAMPMIDASGDVEAVVLSFFDISERIHAEAASRVSEQRFRALVEHAPVSMCITEEHGIFETVNDAFCALHGYAPDDLIGQPFTLLIPQEQQAGALQAYSEHLDRQDVTHLEEEVISLAGESRTMLSTSIPLPGELGNRKRATFSIDITQRKRAEQKMRHLAHYDAVTGLPNRVLFRERLGRTVMETQQRGEIAALLFLDLDGFKSVNDQYGHDVGDQLLHAVAGCLQRCTRSSDTVARLAGDEFTIILRDVHTAENCGLVARNILKELAHGFVLDGQSIVLGASIGITLIKDGGVDPDTLLEHADTAMYRAKHGGKNSYRFA